MVWEIFTAMAIVAIVLFILGLGIFRVSPMIGLIAGVGVFLVLLGVTLSAFGGVGFVTTILNNAWVQYLLVGSASYVMGTVVALFFS